MKTKTVYPEKGDGKAVIYPELHVKIQGWWTVSDLKKLIKDVKWYNKYWQRLEEEKGEIELPPGFIIDEGDWIDEKGRLLHEGEWIDKKGQLHNPRKGRGPIIVFSRRKQ